jgi:hypothetical protein
LLFPFLWEVLASLTLSISALCQLTSRSLLILGSVNQLAREPEIPKISTESKTAEVGIGGSAMLELRVEGYPKPDIKW